MKRFIEFDKEKYDTKYIGNTLRGFANEKNCIFLIDIDFHVYVKLINKKIQWIGDAGPYDLDWFDLQFTDDTGGNKCKKTENQFQKN